MPAIHLFRRKTLLGGDDLHIPCIFGMVIRLIQLVAFLLPVWLHIQRESDGHLWEYITRDPAPSSECRKSQLFALLLFLYAFTSTLLAFLSFVLEARTYQVSSWGTPIETRPRSKKVERLLELKLLPWTVCQALVVILGIAVVCVAHNYTLCRTTFQISSDDDDVWSQITAWMQEDANDGTKSQSNLWWIPYVLLILSQSVEVVFNVSISLQLFRSPPQSATAHALHHELVEEMWQERCMSFCECLGWSTCFMFGGRQVRLGEFGDVARALADYLESGGVLDLVPSDVAAGLMVLQRIQRKRRLEAREEVVGELRMADSFVGSCTRLLEPSGPSLRQRTPFYLMQMEGSRTFYETSFRKVLSRQNTMDLSTIQEGARFARYQLAIYTFLIYVYQNPASGCPRLLNKSRGCLCCCSKIPTDDEDQSFLECHEGRVIGNDFCGVHKAALLLQAGIEDTDLVYAQLHSSFSEIPYCILIDHEWQSVVLAIRGTFSLEDCVTDVMVDPESLEELGNEYRFNAKDQYCHGGVMNCARIVMTDLNRHGILERLLLGDDAKYPSYTLRVVGHSLGAATATLISYMLRPKFSSLRCLNYSPPGCSFTWGMATECQDWCLAFVLDSDLVPRLSRDTMEHLRDEVLDLFGRIKVPKIELARKIFGSASRLSSRSAPLNEQQDVLQHTIEEILYNTQEVPLDSDYQRQLHTFRSVQSERRSIRGRLRSVKLFPPGRMVHFMKTSQRKTCGSTCLKCLTCCTTNVGSQYTPVWVKNDDFNEIVIGSTMGTDHFPNRICTTMEQIATDYGVDRILPSYLNPLNVVGGEEP